MIKRKYRKVRCLGCDLEWWVKPFSGDYCQDCHRYRHGLSSYNPAQIPSISELLAEIDKI